MNVCVIIWWCILLCCGTLRHFEISIGQPQEQSSMDKPETRATLDKGHRMKKKNTKNKKKKQKKKQTNKQTSNKKRTKTNTK